MSEFQHTYSGGETECTHCRALWRGENLRTECPTLLRAEVERLREMLLNAGWPREAEELAALALRSERAAVVAWLLERGHYTAEAYAGSIERGEHRRGEGA